MKKAPIRLGIFTARNLKTTSDCSPETILNILGSLKNISCVVDILLMDDLVPNDKRVTEEELLGLPMYVPFSDVLMHPKINRVRSISEMRLVDIKNDYDMAIVAIYNDYGEDGKLLGMLELLGLPYLSPSQKVSSVCFDKYYAKALLKQAGVSTPSSFFVDPTNCKTEYIHTQILNQLSYPVVVKAVSSGNSWGVTVVREQGELENAINASLEYSAEILVEAYVDGDEFTVGVVGNYWSPQPLPVVSIVHSSQFFDYTAKYQVEGSTETCPADISEELRNMIQEAACSAYKAVKCDSHARIDIILGKDGHPYVLDINTFPGLNRASLFPKELLASGSSLASFLSEQISLKTK